MRRIPLNDGWAVRPKPDRFAERFGEAPEWAPVTLPHDAMIGSSRSPEAGAANGYFPGGTWEYQRALEVTADAGDAVILLEFEGVYRDAVVSVNGTVAAHRPYGYSNFFVPVDHLLTRGAENEVRVEARAGHDTRWYSGAGIYRNVWLLESGRVHLASDGLQIRTPEIDDGGAVVTVTAVVRNRSVAACTAILRVDVLAADRTTVASTDTPVTTFPGDTLTVRTMLSVQSPRRWGLDDPYLYTCRAQLVVDDDVVDEESTTFGIRSVALDSRRGLRINGEPVLLRGACVHHDNGVLGAATIPRAEARRVELLKASGFNAIRSAHNPMSRAMLAACDRIGMLVMDETFDMWTRAKTNSDYSRSFPDWWEADVDAMVVKDRNHPSVILYSIGNEIPETGQPAGAALGRAIAARIRALDDTRFVTNSINALLACGRDLFASFASVAEAPAEGTGVNTMLTQLMEYLPVLMQAEIVGERTAESFAAVDVAGYNYLESRYELDHELFPNRVIVGTETRPPLIDANWKQVKSNPHVIGDFTWTGWDYLGEAGIGRIDDTPRAAARGDEAAPSLLGAYPWLTSWTGDLDITGHRRPVSYWREIVFGLRREPYIAVQRPELHGKAPTHVSNWAFSDAVSSWSWSGFEGRPVAVEVYADSDEVELLVNGTVVGRAPAGEDRRFRAEFEAVYEPGEIVAVAYRGGGELARTSLVSARGPVCLDTRVDRREIRADDTDLAFVEINLVDAKGTTHATADRAVTVTVEGPGVLQGLGSADPRTEETFATPTHHTYEGRALAVVRPTGAGTITVSVTAAGCDPQTLLVDARSSSA